VSARVDGVRHRDYLGVGVAFPIRVDHSGGLALAEYEESVQEAIWIILGSARGERQMRPRFGCGIHEYVFAPDSAGTRAGIARAVRSGLTEWEPRIDVLDVRVDAVPDEENKLLIEVDYRVRSNNAFHNLVYPFYITEGT